MKVNVRDVIGSGIAISATKGEIVYKELTLALKENVNVELDFEGITDLTTAFLNVAIGHLYSEYSGEELNDKLDILNLDELDKYLLKQVIERVKMNQDEAKEFENLVKEVLDDGED
ncbi:STAS-like domain-containing protein [Viridibacillus sp. NPDC096237]|uniref:STAS-like domain-containing protein n=1 Tax=Viridibacillus sp. NPDC096237 TaxID=3390721 RepID=UPI003CFFB0CC